jgi:hypothetical protein
MREATYQDATSVGQLLNVHRDEVWKILKGMRYSTESELCLAVHNAFKGHSGPPSSNAVPSTVSDRPHRSALPGE